MSKKPITSFSGRYHFLSNFYNCDVLFEKVVYPSAEHAYQASKTDNLAERAWIVGSTTPAKAKRIGNIVSLRPNWTEQRLNYMYTVLKAKFSNPKLKKKLLSTVPATLIEGNIWHDNFWGDCECAKCRHITGQNQLGEFLMQLRQEFEEEG